MVSCKADGFPVPVIQWKQSIGSRTFILFIYNHLAIKMIYLGDSGEYRDLSIATDNGNSHSIAVATSNGSLSISKVNREHEGSYLCQATNGIGAGLSTLIKLTVHGKYKLNICP